MKTQTPLLKILLLQIILWSAGGYDLNGQNASDQYHFQNIKITDEEKFTSTNNFLKVMQDTLGFIWVVTEAEGLMRYDGKEFQPLISLMKNTLDVQAIPRTWTDEYAIDGFGRIWFNLFHSEGVYILNPYEMSIKHIEHFLNPVAREVIGTNNKEVMGIAADNSGNIWLGSANDLFVYKCVSDTIESVYHDSTSLRISPQVATSDFIVLFIKQEVNKTSLPYIFNTKERRNSPYNMVKSGTWKLKVFESNLVNHVWEVHSQFGIRKRDLTSNTYQTFLRWSDNSHLTYNNIVNIWEDRNNTIYINSGGNGIFIFDSINNDSIHLIHNKKKVFSLVNNNIHASFFDSNNNQWINTPFGMSVLSAQANNFEHYALNYFFEIPNGNTIGIPIISEFNSSHFFLCTSSPEFGLYNFDKKTKKISNHFDGNSILGQKKFNGYIHQIYKDHKNILWISVLNKYTRREELYFYSFATKQIHSFETIHNNKATNISVAFEDKNQDIYFFIDPSSHLFKLNKNRDGLDTIEIKNKPLTVSWSYYNATSNQLWMATKLRIPCVLELAKKECTCFEYDSKNPKSISNSTARVFYKDSKDNMWIGTANGLNKYNPQDQSFERFLPSDGLPGKNVHGILEDDHGNLWLSFYESGISKFNPETKKIISFNTSSALGTNRFWEQCSIKDEDGYFYYGNDEGLTIFHPDSIKLNETIPKVYLTKLKLFNKDLLPDSSNSILQRPLTITKSIELRHDQNVLTFEYTALNYINPEKNEYAYMMEGFDKDWQYVGNKREATYTNLSPGTYTFRVKGSNNHGVWNETGASLQITIHPPWYHSSVAYFVYTLLGAFLLYAIFRFQLNRQLQKREAKQIKELSEFKSRLYTNITHEFRTPLTLILGPAKKARKHLDRMNKTDIEDHFSMIEKNGKLLLDRVNQLLDLNKIDSGMMPCHYLQGDVIPYLKYLLDSFHSLASAKNIELSFQTNLEKLVMDYDKEKWLTIISNLLSNALKFTPENGRVTLTVAKQDDKPLLECRIADTGIGIPKEKIAYIFDRFYQADHIQEQTSPGSGIGLALAYEYVSLLNGSISVNSEPGNGSVFKVILPIRNHAPLAVEPQRSVSPESMKEDATALNEDLEGDRPLVLIVEDQKDVAHFIGQCLSEKYRVGFAQNGKIGLDKAREVIPDFILSDVMMPDMNGLELCQHLKADELTMHIPVVLLTAKAGTEARLEGLKVGADAYLTKPFDEEELLVRIEKLVELREKLRRKFTTAEPSTSNQTQTDFFSTTDAFLQKVNELIDANLENEALNPDLLSTELFYSKMQVHRKIKALTDHSTANYIRTFRLHRSRELLSSSQYNVSEVAWKTGFNSLSYFSSSFKDTFGISPQQFQEKS